MWLTPLSSQWLLLLTASVMTSMTPKGGQFLHIASLIKKKKKNNKKSFLIIGGKEIIKSCLIKLKTSKYHFFNL